MRALLTLLVLLATPAAGAPLSPEAFAARVGGRTIAWTTPDGQLHGTEQYLPGQRVIWRFADDICLRGTWQAQADRVCFTYEDGRGAQCWHFAETDEGLTARAEGAPSTERLIAGAESRAPLACPTPWLGS